MRNYKACLFTLALAVGMVGLVYAAPGVRGGKGAAVGANTTLLVHVSSTPVTVYSVILSTGGVADFVALFDTANVTNVATVSLAGNFRTRVYATGSASTALNFVFDPPLVFNNGLVFGNSTAVINTLVTYEKGKATAGY